MGEYIAGLPYIRASVFLILETLLKCAFWYRQQLLFRFFSSIVTRRFPFIGVFRFRKRKKSTGAKSVGYGGWGMITVLLLAKNPCTSIDGWAGALSWCKIHDWFFYHSVRFWGIASRNRCITWPYDLVPRIHDLPRHCRQRKQWEKPSNLTKFDVFFRSWLFWTLPLGWWGFDFNFIVMHPWFITRYELFEQIWIVVNIS